MSKFCSALAIACGDPAGIGLEVILKTLADPDFDQYPAPTLFGSRSLLLATYERLQEAGIVACHPDRLTVVEVPLPGAVLENIRLGEGNRASGEASFAYLSASITATLAGQFRGIVTAPIAKTAWRQAGYDFAGQTEVLAQRTGAPSVAMAFVGRSPYTGWILRTLLATTHIPLAQVSSQLNAELLEAKLSLLLNFLKSDCGISQPIVAIAGLNPHSGEAGQLGQEEQAWLIPWLNQARTRYPQAQLLGPIPPDTLWVQAGQAWFRQIPTLIPHAYLALYHDQGLIPVKLMAFDQAVNTTLGLPFVRTSPDHGTAFDIAGQGRARPDSFKAALSWAQSLTDGGMEEKGKTQNRVGG